MELKPLTEVLDEHTPGLMALPGVVGVGIGETGGLACVVVYINVKTGEAVSGIPAGLDGYPIVVEATGDFRAIGPEL
jgi:hypothetical protein